jgi:hypoxanthine phosphoribosyltransferase
VIFVADLARAIALPVSLDFMSVSSYGSGTRSSGVVRLSADLSMSIEGRDVIIVEDIIDSGRTISYLRRNLATRHPRSLALCALLDKVARREVEVAVDYVGFVIPDEFVVGYGLDHDGLHRNLRHIAALETRSAS